MDGGIAGSGVRQRRQREVERYNALCGSSQMRGAVPLARADLEHAGRGRQPPRGLDIREEMSIELELLDGGCRIIRRETRQWSLPISGMLIFGSPPR